MAGRYFAASSSPWNTPLPAATPVHPSNAAYRTALQGMVSANATGWWINRDIFSSWIYEVQGSRTPRVPVTLVDDNGTPVAAVRSATNNATEMAWRFAQGVPIPVDAVAAEGSDQHMCVIDAETSELWEFWLMRKGGWGNISGWACRWGGYMPNHRTNIGIFESPPWGATGTSLPIVAGMMLDKDLRAGVIPHALHLVIPDPAIGFVWPAQRGDGTDPARVLPEGSRFRIKSSVNVNSYSYGGAQETATLRMMAKAMQDYGIVIADRTGSGGPVTFRAEMTTNPYDFGGWPNNFLAAIPFADYEFIADTYRPPVVPRVSSGPPVEQIGFSASRPFDNSFLTESGDTLITEAGDVLITA